MKPGTCRMLNRSLPLSHHILDSCLLELHLLDSHLSKVQEPYRGKKIEQALLFDPILSTSLSPTHWSGPEDANSNQRNSRRF